MQDFRNYKNLRLYLLPIIILVNNYRLSFIYLLFSFIIYILQDRKLLAIREAKGVEKIADMFDNDLIFYTLLLYLIYNFSIFSPPYILLFSLEFLIMGQKALKNILNNKYERLINYIFYTTLIVHMVFLALIFIVSVMSMYILAILVHSLYFIIIILKILQVINNIKQEEN